MPRPLIALLLLGLTTCQDQHCRFISAYAPTAVCALDSGEIVVLSHSPPVGCALGEDGEPGGMVAEACSVDGIFGMGCGRSDAMEVSFTNGTSSGLSIRYAIERGRCSAAVFDEWLEGPWEPYEEHDELCVWGASSSGGVVFDLVARGADPCFNSLYDRCRADLVGGAIEVQLEGAPSTGRCDLGATDRVATCAILIEEPGTYSVRTTSGRSLGTIDVSATPADDPRHCTPIP